MHEIQKTKFFLKSPRKTRTPPSSSYTVWAFEDLRLLFWWATNDRGIRCPSWSYRQLQSFLTQRDILLSDAETRRRLKYVRFRSRRSALRRTGQSTKAMDYQSLGYLVSFITYLVPPEGSMFRYPRLYVYNSRSSTDFAWTETKIWTPCGHNISQVWEDRK